MGQLLEYINYKNMKTLEYNAQTGEITERELTAEEVGQAEKLMSTESELVKQSIEQKLQEITDYDSSDSVNSFSINGVNMWLDFDERARIRVSIDAYKANGNTTMEKYFNGTPFSFPLEVWTQMLNMLEVYASEALNVTEKHKMDVSNLTTVQDVLSYNYKTGYPQKLSF